MRPVDVVLPPDAPAAVRATLGSLPQSFVIAEQPRSDAPWVTVLDGAPGWPERLLAGAARDPACVVLLEPAPQAAEELARLRAAVLPPVIVTTRWAANPGLVAGLAAVAGWSGEEPLPREPRLLDCRTVVATGDDPVRALCDQLVLLRSVNKPVEELDVRWTAEGFSARAALTAGGRVTISSIASDAEAPRCELLAVGADAVLRVVVPDWASAEPAVVTRTEPRSSRRAGPVYESASRAVWRRVRELVTGQRDSGDLPGWLIDQAAAHAASTRGADR